EAGAQGLLVVFERLIGHVRQRFGLFLQGFLLFWIRFVLHSFLLLSLSGLRGLVHWVTGTIVREHKPLRRDSESHSLLSVCSCAVHASNSDARFPGNPLLCFQLNPRNPCLSTEFFANAQFFFYPR